MAIKSILCIFDGKPYELDALNTSMLLAKMHNAQLRILHLSIEPYVHDIHGEGIILSSELSTAFEKQNAERLAKAKTYAAEFAEKHQLPLNLHDLSTHHASVRFLHSTGLIDNNIAQEGRISDLIIMSRSTTPFMHKLEPALFNTGCPVLLMPAANSEILRPWQDKIAALAWNGSLEAARALRNAIPLLKQVEKLYVLMIHPHTKPVERRQQDGLISYLQGHNINAEMVIVDHNHQNKGPQALSEAKALKADLLIMGAYGHSVFREIIIGGFTEYMLSHAEIPLVLSH